MQLEAIRKPPEPWELTSTCFVQLFTGELGGIFPAQGIWFVLFAVILFLVLNRGRFGNWFIATTPRPRRTFL